MQAVHYVGLPSHPHHRLAQEQFGATAGAMFTLDLESQEACFDFLNRLRLFRRATNLFDSRSLAIHPYSTIFGNFSAEQREAMDVRPTTVRLSVGLEQVDDLRADLLQALS